MTSVEQWTTSRFSENRYVAYDSQGHLLRLQATEPRVTIAAAEEYQNHAEDVALPLVETCFAEFALSHSGLLASYSPGNLFFSMALFLGRVTVRKKIDTYRDK